MSVPQPSVAVRGSAQRSAAPDFFTLGIGVDVHGGSASTVTDELARQFSRVDEVLSGLATPQLTIERSRASIRRTTSWEGTDKRDLEWLGTRAVQLLGRDTAQVTDLMRVIDQLIREVGGLTLDGPHWQLNDDNTVYASVQVDAVRDAEARAQRYCAAVGSSLGDLVELSDPNVRDRSPVLLARAVSAPAGGLGDLNFTPEDVSVSATVEGRWLIAR